MGRGTSDAVLGKIDIADVWGVGRQYEGLLRRSGIRTARDLKYADQSWIRKKMTVTGLRTVLELQGVACIPAEEGSPPRKGICSSRSFGCPVAGLGELSEALSEYTGRAAEKLRRQASLATVLQVYLGTNRFKPEPQYRACCTCRLPAATADTPELIRRACACLRSIYRPGYRYQKTGVFLTGLHSRTYRQPCLFGAGQSGAGHRRLLMDAFDRINERWGCGTARFGGGGPGSRWQMRRAHCTPRYTTSWSDLPLIKA